MVTLTPDAIKKVRSLLEKEAKQDYALRIFITGGGCAGFSYGMVFDDTIEEDDYVVEADGLKVVIDPLSAQYLKGAEIDYIDGLMGSGFTINNPNAVSTCACGHSFSTEQGKVHSGRCR